MSWSFMNYAYTLAFIPSCFISLSTHPTPTPSTLNSPNSTSSSSLSFLLGRGHSWRFIHVLIHVKSFLIPLPGNCSFCVLVFTHANINDNISPSQPLWELLCSNELEFLFFLFWFVFVSRKKKSRSGEWSQLSA